MKLKIKDCYIGSIITIRNKKNEIKFDTLSAKKNDYQYYYDNGFDNMFEVIKPIKYKGIEKNKDDKDV